MEYQRVLLSWHDINRVMNLNIISVDNLKNDICNQFNQPVDNSRIEYFDEQFQVYCEVTNLQQLPTRNCKMRLVNASVPSKKREPEFAIEKDDRKKTKLKETDRAKSRFDECTLEDIAYMTYVNTKNQYCEGIVKRAITGDELYEAIKPMNGKLPKDYTEEEMDRVVSLLKCGYAIHMPGSSKEAYDAITCFYGEFLEVVSKKPRLQAELDMFYVVVDFSGQAAPPTYAAQLAALPPVLGSVDPSPTGSGTIFTFGGTGAAQFSRSNIFVGHIGGAYGPGAVAATPVPTHLIQMAVMGVPVYWY